MADRRRAEPDARRVVGDIDRRLKSLDGEIARYEELVQERERLRAARATLLGESPRTLRQEDITAYLREHPGSRAKQIADALGVPLTNVSAHLYRGSKQGRFVNGPDGWRARETEDR